jgi:hypothetical protein
MKFTDTVLSDVTDFSAVNFFVNLKAVYANTARFYVRFMKDGIIASSTVEIISGSYNFNRNTVNIYQQVIIPITAFSFTSGNINGLEIFMMGSNASGFRMDNIVFSVGNISPSIGQKAITSIVTDSGVANATAKDDVFTFKGFGGLVVSAIGKVISFTQASTPSHFKGVHPTFSSLTTAHPTASEGDYAQVNEFGATDVVNYNWDAEESIWVQGGSGGVSVPTDVVNKLVTIDLADLGVATIDDVTDTILKNYINSLNITVLEGEVYYFQIDVPTGVIEIPAETIPAYNIPAYFIPTKAWGFKDEEFRMNPFGVLAKHPVHHNLDIIWNNEKSNELHYSFLPTTESSKSIVLKTRDIEGNLISVGTTNLVITKTTQNPSIPQKNFLGD